MVRSYSVFEFIWYLMNHNLLSSVRIRVPWQEGSHARHVRDQR